MDTKKAGEWVAFILMLCLLAIAVASTIALIAWMLD